MFPEAVKGAYTASVLLPVGKVLFPVALREAYTASGLCPIAKVSFPDVGRAVKVVSLSQELKGVFQDEHPCRVM